MKLQNNYVQMTSNSKWFNCIADHVAGICLLTASDLSRFIEFIFANVIFDTQKVKNSDHKTDLNAFQLYNLKIMIFQKRKLANRGNPSKTPKYWNMST